MTNINRTLPILLILIVASFLRLYQLGELPNSYTPDEVAQGYTAYSILKTGHDEWGNSQLLNLRSFGDFKPPLQTFLMIPSIKIFGLTPFAIRLPNALLSIASVLCIIYLTYQLFNNFTVAIISGVLLTFSPWHLPVSRIALEANLSVFLILLSTIFWLSKNKFTSLFATIFLIVNIFTYHSAKIFTPIYVFLTMVVLKLYSKLFFIIIISSFFLVGILTYSSLFTRVGDISILNPTDHWQSLSNLQFDLTQNGLPFFISRTFNNKISLSLNTFITNYFSYFSPQFLITSGAGETTYGMLPGFGVLGIIVTFSFLYSFTKPNKKNYWLLLCILAGAIPAALSKGYYPANRLLITLPFFIIISSFGLYQIFKYRPKYLSLILLLLFIFETSNFLITYYYHGNIRLAQGMLYGHQQAIRYLSKYPSMNVIYSRKLSEPQSYTAFFTKYEPSLFQKYSASWLPFLKDNKLQFVDQIGQYSLGSLTYKEISFSSDSLLPNTILVGKPEEFPGVKPTYIINYPSSSVVKPAIYIYKNND